MIYASPHYNGSHRAYGSAVSACEAYVMIDLGYFVVVHENRFVGASVDTCSAAGSLTLLFKLHKPDTLK